MSDPSADSNPPLRPEDVPPLEPPVGDATQVSPLGQRPSASDPAAAIQKAADAPRDDSPTIISRAPRVRRNNEAIAADLRGKRLAHFELLEPVGVGGMAAVIRAQDKQLDRCVALKILPPQMATDPESIRRFHQEARSAARLDHENIARVFYCGEDQGLYFIAFEFVEGENLRTILDRRGRIPVAEAIHYVLQVAAGLAHAAARAVVHRDIKPSNIIITPTGRAKLVDMGLARSLGPQADGELTHSGVTLGTFDYISPEQALEPRDADARSDIYSLGCTLYHMLTGQPPVPEGTAAKKLHCHQHVPPLDPRQLEPRIPDDVAAILARMMAKEPRERYQRPEHLVQHLLQQAKRLGCSVDVPEGVHYVDAPLPSPPRTRPVLIGAIAAAVIVGLVGLLGILSNSGVTAEAEPDRLPANVAETVPPGGEKTPPPAPDPIKPPGGEPVRLPETSKVVQARNTRELVQHLQQPVVWIRLTADHYELRADDFGGDVPGLVFRGVELHLEPDKSAKVPPTIRLKYNPAIVAKDPLAILTVLSGQVTIRGIRFVIDAAGTETAMTALAYKDGILRVKNCEFDQQELPNEVQLPHTNSLHVETTLHASSGRPNVSLESCFFRAGHEGILISSSAAVTVDNCAFGPHGALFSFRGPKVHRDETEINLSHCSAMLRSDEAAFQLEAGASCRLTVNHCLFSCPSDVQGEGATLVRQIGEPTGELRYESQAPNVYHNFTDFWLQESRAGALQRLAITLADFLKQTNNANRMDRWLDQSVNPWLVEKPLDLFASQPKRAFAINPKLPELRQSKDPAKPIGVERGYWGPLLNGPLPPLASERPDPVVQKVRIVDPNVKRSDQGLYPTLGQALGEANSGDTILIRSNGTMPVDPVRLVKPSVDVTIRPAPKHHPILTLGEAADPDAALFQLHDGKLNLVDLVFRLQPRQSGFKGHSVVILAGDGQCSFKNCVATLEASKEVRVALLTLADSSVVMKMAPPSPQVPRVRLENCFVRGDGDLISVRASRPFHLDLEDCLVALEGSLLTVDGNPKEIPVKSARVSLRQVTAFLGEHLILLRAAKEEMKQGLVPTEVSPASNCLFHSARGKTLVHLEGVDTDEQMRRLFSWEGTQNLYSGFTSLLDQQPRGDNAVALPPYDPERWETFAKGETERRYAKVKFTSWPVLDRPLSRSWPMNFGIKEPDGIRCGSPVEKLPRPVEERTSEPERE